MAQVEQLLFSQGRHRKVPLNLNCVQDTGKLCSVKASKHYSCVSKLDLKNNFNDTDWIIYKPVPSGTLWTVKTANILNSYGTKERTPTEI